MVEGDKIIRMVSMYCSLASLKVLPEVTLRLLFLSFAFLANSSASAELDAVMERYIRFFNCFPLSSRSGLPVSSFKYS